MTEPHDAGLKRMEAREAKRRDLLDLLIYVGHLEYEIKELGDEAAD